MLKEDLRPTVEVYWQHLYDVPVENDPNSAFSLGNQRVVHGPAVGEQGRGAQRGRRGLVGEILHALGTSRPAMWKRATRRWTAWRNSRFHVGPVANVLAGKEWKLGPEGKDRVLTTGLRYTVMGGRYATPIDPQASIAAGGQKDGDDAWSLKGDAVHKVDAVVSYRVGRPKASHEFKVDVQNVLNASTTVLRYYDRRTETIKNAAIGHPARVAIHPSVLTRASRVAASRPPGCRRVSPNWICEQQRTLRFPRRVTPFLICEKQRPLRP